MALPSKNTVLLDTRASGPPYTAGLSSQGCWVLSGSAPARPHLASLGDSAFLTPGRRAGRAHQQRFPQELDLMFSSPLLPRVLPKCKSSKNV